PQPVQLRMTDFHSQWEPTFRLVLDAYEKKNPGTYVALEAPPADSYNEKLLISVAAGVAPDFFSINMNGVRQFAAKDLIVDLTPYGQSDKQFGTDLAAYNEVSRSMMSWQGKQMAVGLDQDDIGIYWNVDLFTKAGVPPLTDVMN